MRTYGFMSDINISRYMTKTKKELTYVVDNNVLK